MHRHNFHKRHFTLIFNPYKSCISMIVAIYFSPEYYPKSFSPRLKSVNEYLRRGEYYPADTWAFTTFLELTCIVL